MPRTHKNQIKSAQRSTGGGRQRLVFCRATGCGQGKTPTAHKPSLRPTVWGLGWDGAQTHRSPAYHHSVQPRSRKTDKTPGSHDTHRPALWCAAQADQRHPLCCHTKRHRCRMSSRGQPSHTASLQRERSLCIEYW